MFTNIEAIINNAVKQKEQEITDEDRYWYTEVANGEIPSNCLYEDELVKVILDLSPASKGHALILPKEHYANLYEMPDEMLAKVMSLAKVWGEKLVKAFDAEDLVNFRAVEKE